MAKKVKQLPAAEPPIELPVMHAIDKRTYDSLVRFLQRARVGYYSGTIQELKLKAKSLLELLGEPTK